MRKDDREAGRASATLFGSLVLALLVVFLTFLSLWPGVREDQRPPPGRAEPSPSPSQSLSAGGSIGPVGSANGGGGSGVVLCRSATCRHAFTISGSVGGLYPGKTAPLTLTIENPNAQDIRVTAITVSVTGTSTSSCSTSYLQTNNYGGAPFIVHGGATSNVSVMVTMSRAAPDACQSVTFELTYGGQAEEV